MMSRVHQERTSPFLLTLRISGMLLHNCLVDSGSGLNIMTEEVAHVLGLQIRPWPFSAAQLDNSEVPIIGFVHQERIELAAHQREYQCIDIAITRTTSKFGMILGRGWSRLVNAYFSSDWTHMWLMEHEVQIHSEPQMRYLISLQGQSNEVATTSEVQLYRGHARNG